MKVILTGASGLVGEGVLMECLSHPGVEKILMINRRPLPVRHAKLQELIVPDFLQLEQYSRELTGYDACFFCAGVSAKGMSEAEYTSITYDMTLSFAKALVEANSNMVFEYVSGSQTDSTEHGRFMWARVKGRTENALFKVPFKKAYAIRPGLMQPSPGQRNVKGYYKILGALYPLLHRVLPNQVSTMRDVGLAMIRCAMDGYAKPILEIGDINALAGGGASPKLRASM